MFPRVLHRTLSKSSSVIFKKDASISKRCSLSGDLQKKLLYQIHLLLAFINYRHSKIYLQINILFKIQAHTRERAYTHAYIFVCVCFASLMEDQQMFISFIFIFIYLYFLIYFSTVWTIFLFSRKNININSK